MKVVLLLTIYWLSVVLAHPIDDSKDDQWEWIPTADGHFHLVNSCDYESLSEKVADFEVKFLLFTRENPTTGQEIISGDPSSLQNSNFNTELPTRFVIHGWLGNPNQAGMIEIRDAYLKRGSFNVIGVDWSAAAGNLNYIAARLSVVLAGIKVARFMDFLNSRGTPSNNIYLIGHSLGAHVSGMAGKNARNKPGAIYGLDPAGPLFTCSPPEDRLYVDDALYVQTIHTNTAIYGYSKPMGKSSFYPAWGRWQPNCGLLRGICSHFRSIKYFAESLSRSNKPFLGRKCSWSDIQNEECQGTVTNRMGGDPANSNVIGEYYVPVNPRRPFATGTV